MLRPYFLAQSNLMLTIYLKPGRERPVLNGHPWIFSGAIERVEGDLDSVGVADVFDCKKNWLARGFYNPRSQIRVRLLTWQQENIDGGFFARRLAQAHAFRVRHLPAISPLSRPPAVATTQTPVICPVVAAAIANAIFDATGVRVRRQPLTAQTVLAALRAAGKSV